MPVSLNSVIHYTNNLDNLKGIISENFKIKYCLETVTQVGVAFPMVSFCDIPLSQIKEHLNSYGKYGIGLSKEWANANNLNPVLYVSDNSHVDRTLRSQSMLVDEAMRSGKPLDRMISHQFISLLSFVKSFKGTINRNDVAEEVVFYNEREWRYVPPWNQLVVSGLSPQIYGPTYIEKKVKFNADLKDFRLNFDMKDISYLIVQNEDDIHEVIEHIKQIYSQRSAKEIELLVTKILTTKQIVEDF